MRESANTFSKLKFTQTFAPSISQDKRNRKKKSNSKGYHQFEFNVESGYHFSLRRNVSLSIFKRKMRCMITNSGIKFWFQDAWLLDFIWIQLSRGHATNGYVDKDAKQTTSFVVNYDNIKHSVWKNVGNTCWISIYHRISMCDGKR